MEPEGESNLSCPSPAFSSRAYAIGVAIAGTILATLFTGTIATSSSWSPQRTEQFRQAVTISGLTLTVVAWTLVGWAILRMRDARDHRPSTSIAATNQ